jgi:hypothetical protein
LRRILRKQRLLNFAGNLQVVLKAVKLLLGFRFTKSGLNIFANFAGNTASNKSSN